MVLRRAYLEEGHGGPAGDRSVSDLRLLREVVGRLDRRHHPLDREEGGQVGRVRRDDDEREEPPDAADDARRHRLRVDVGALLHQRADSKPEAVGEGEHVLHHLVVGVARVRVVPLVGAEAGEHEHQHADEEVGGDHVDPDLDGERVEEREEAGALAPRLLEEDADAEVHERLGEVDHLLAHVGDGQRRDGQVGLLQAQRNR